jgi:hypothetical protein
MGPEARAAYMEGAGVPESPLDEDVSLDEVGGSPGFKGKEV